MANATIRGEEAAHFGALAADWWDPKGASAMLHRLNPVRLGFLRESVDAHWQGDSRSVRPLLGKRALDVGCGAGLLCEPLARLGASVTGVDAAEENIAAASAHAAGGGLAIDYRCGEIGALDIGQFDLVCSMEVIEHVADKAAFVSALADRLAPGGLMVLSTPNRTAKSRLLMVEAAERIGMVPRHPSLGRFRDAGGTARSARRRRADDGHPARDRLEPGQGPAPRRRPGAQLHRHRHALIPLRNSRTRASRSSQVPEMR